MNNLKVFFTMVPYGGSFKYKDEFLIYPPPSNTEDYIQHKPAILEFNNEEASPEYFDDPDHPNTYPVPQSAVQAQSDQRKCDELLRLLSLLTNYSHFQYPNFKAWFIPIDTKMGEFPLARWGQAFIPSIDLESSTPKYDEVAKKDSVKYYDDNFFRRITDEVVYPETIEELLDKYFLLEEKHREVLDKSIRLFNQGLELETKMPSMAVVAFISAIENIVTYDSSGTPEDTCKCGEIKYGVTKKFRVFVGRYIRAESNTQRKKYVEDIYGLRSKIVHAGGLHAGDLDSNMWEGNQEENPFLLNEIEQVTRICLINWFKNC